MAIGQFLSPFEAAGGEHDAATRLDLVLATEVADAHAADLAIGDDQLIKPGVEPHFALAIENLLVDPAHHRRAHRAARVACGTLATPYVSPSTQEHLPDSSNPTLQTHQA